MKIELPQSVALIIRELEANGHEAYAVGGCVRDVVMGRTPNDWDITTSAKPEEVKAIFNKTIDTGIKHGTVTVMIHKVGYEVTTYRVDGEYEDGRHPKEVSFTKNLKKDLERRDFTINAMAYNHRTGLVDCFDGLSDIKNRKIRCVGRPESRFAEDSLRILRAIRFAAQLDFDIEENTLKAVTDMAATLDRISRERIQAELEKLLMSDRADKLYVLKETGVINNIMPEHDFTDISAADFKNIAEITKSVKKDRYLRWAAFLSYTGENCRRILKNLKFDNKTVDIVSKLVSNGHTAVLAEDEAVRRNICLIGRDIYDKYLDFKEDVIGEDMSEVRRVYARILERGDCLTIADMKVRGADLYASGIEPGVKMGELIRYLFDEVLKNPELNKKETLIEMAKNKK